MVMTDFSSISFFKSIDYACSYGAAFGRLYVSQNYVCFHSKILNRNVRE